MYDETAYHDIEQEDSRTRLLKELTDEVNEKNIIIEQLERKLKHKFDTSDPMFDVPADIKRISKVISHLTRHLRLTKDVGSKARLGTSISSLNKQKHVMVSQVMEIYEIIENNKKKNKTDMRYN